MLVEEWSLLWIKYKGIFILRFIKKHAMKAWRNGGINPYIELLASLQASLLPVKETRYLLEGLGGPQRRSWGCIEEKTTSLFNLIPIPRSSSP
jgi:hypothetical protein